MKKFLNSKAFIFLIAFLIGGLATYGILSLKEEKDESLSHLITQNEKTASALNSFKQKEKQVHSLLNDFFSDDFFQKDPDPFEEMKKMRKKFQHFFDESDFFHEDQKFDSFFDNWYGKKYGGFLNDMKQSEDKDFFYYEFAIPGIKSDQIEVTTENGTLKIKGEINNEITQNDENRKSYQKSSSSFYRHLPLPEDADDKNVQVLPQKDKILIKIPKKES